MPNLGIPELLIILVIALVIFGPGKLPDLGKALGSSLREFQRSVRGEDSPADDNRTGEEPGRPKA